MAVKRMALYRPKEVLHLLPQPHHTFAISSQFEAGIERWLVDQFGPMQEYELICDPGARWQMVRDGRWYLSNHMLAVYDATDATAFRLRWC